MTVSTLLLAAEQLELQSRKGEVNFFQTELVLFQHCVGIGSIFFFLMFQYLFTNSALKHAYFKKCGAVSSQKELF